MALTNVCARRMKTVDHTVLMFFVGMIGSLFAAIVILVEGVVKGEFRVYTPY